MTVVVVPSATVQASGGGAVHESLPSPIQATKVTPSTFQVGDILYVSCSRQCALQPSEVQFNGQTLTLLERGTTWLKVQVPSGVQLDSDGLISIENYPDIVAVNSLEDISINGAENEFTQAFIDEIGWVWGGNLPATLNTTYADFFYDGTDNSTSYRDATTAESLLTVGQTINYKLYFTTNDFRLRIRLDRLDSGSTQLGFDSTTGPNNPLYIAHTITQTDLDEGGIRFYVYGGASGTGTVRVQHIEVYVT